MNSLKKKALLGISTILVGFMLITMFMVLLVTSRQSRQTARQLLYNTFNIIDYTLSEKQNKLLLDSRQMATLDDMGGKIKYVTDSCPYFKFDIMRPTYITITTILYNIGASAGIWKVAIFNTSGELISFAIIEEDTNTLGYIHNQETIEIASLGPDQQLIPDSWTACTALPDTSFEQDRETANREEVNKDTIHFDIIDGSFCLVAHVPVMGRDYNPQTEKMESKQVGTLLAIQKLDNEFVGKLSDLTGAEINIFGKNGLIAGTLEEYKTFDLSRLTDSEIQWSGAKQRVIFNDINLSNEDYSQGILPVYSDSKCVGAITSLYSNKIAMANTARIIKLLSFVYFICIVIIVPVIGLMVVRGIINPIQKMVSMMQDITRKKEFDELLKIESNDEIGQLASAFNVMTTELNSTTTSIDNLNQEISERKKVEQELLQLLSLHDATLEATGDGILVVDLKGNIVTRNHRFLKLWHISDDMAKNRDDQKQLAYVLDQLKSPEEFLAEVQRLYSCPEESSADILEFKDGRVYERLSHPQKISTNIVGRVWSFHDITDLKKAEEAASLAYTKLEETNEELIRVQSQLIQNEKLSSIGQLAAGVAHEINNPIGFVASNFETLENYVVKFKKLLSMYGELVEEIRKSPQADHVAKSEAIEKIREELKMGFVLEDIHVLFEDSREGLSRITKIIQSLRDFSRIDQVTDICEFNLNEGILDTLVVAKNEIKYDCEIRTEFSEIPPVTCNPGQINQVILNILVNAAQAIKSQGRAESGNINIKTYVDNTYVICEITDDGPGIPGEIIHKVFDPFFTTKPVGKGTGLGLSISRDIIVNKHKGQLTVKSEVGKGAIFMIRLPIQFIPSESEEDSKHKKNLIGNFT